MKKILIFLLAAAICLAHAGCGSDPGAGKTPATGGAFPASDEGALNLIKEFTKAGADHAALSKKLRPAKADYEAVFERDLAAKADAVYSPAWDAGQLVVAPKAGQTEVKISSATSDEIKAWTGAATDFPEGWKQVAPQLKPGVKIYKFKFVEPGSELGMAYEGLVNVNGSWRIFPKPWRAMN